MSANVTVARPTLFGGERRKWWTLAAVSFGLFMIMLDNTIVNVALPAMQRDLGLRLSSLQWVVAGYALSYASLMLVGGKLADAYGRRLLFMIGMAGFTAASLACGLAPDGGTLVAARVGQGVAAALMSPATLSIIAAAFPPRQRGTAIGIWAGTSALALAIGPLAGGLITEHLSWHWIFFVNVPVGGVGLLAARVLVDESRDQTHERLDLPGLGTSSLGLFALTYGLIEANTYGWGSQRIVAAFAVATLSLAAFLWLERSQRAPLLHLELFRDRTFLGANLAVMLVTLSMFGVFFFVSLYLQNVRGFSAVQAGASFLPLTVLIVIVAPIAGRLADRVGSRWLMTTGMLCLSGHLVLLARLQADSSYLSILPAMIVGGLGMAVVMTPASAAAMKAVPVDKAGVGSGVLNTFRQVGGAVGIALMGAIVAAAGNGVQTSQAFLHGLHVALIVGALIALAGAVVAAWLVRAQHAPAGATSGSARAETA